MPERASLPAFFYRLSAQDQRRYLRSDQIDRFPFTPGPATLAGTRMLLDTLAGGSLATINIAAQTLLSEICRDLEVAPIRVEIRGVRPRDARRELHGIFYPHARPPRLIVWMRTARRREVVRPKTFLRTLAHEFCHYLDYALLDLGDSFHTQGFFKRESFLVRCLYPSPQRNAGQASD